VYIESMKDLRVVIINKRYAGLLRRADKRILKPKDEDSGRPRLAVGPLFQKNGADYYTYLINCPPPPREI